jgi:hypothetical protein
MSVQVGKSGFGIQVSGKTGQPGSANPVLLL